MTYSKDSGYALSIGIGRDDGMNNGVGRCNVLNGVGIPLCRPFKEL
jgi:hypothetical protein